MDSAQGVEITGINPKVVSERLGHHSVACAIAAGGSPVSRSPPKRRCTLDTYAHVIPGMQSEAVQRLADLIDGSDREPDADQEGM